MKNHHYNSRNNIRKARTRTLIQLGGLVEKSGLFEVLGIIPGADLQKDETMMPLAMGLLGALLDLKKEINKDQSLLTIWQLNARKYLDEADKEENN